MSVDPGEIYQRSCDLYDRIYHWKDYEKETSIVVELLESMGLDTGARLLEVACGTGNYLQYLSQHYDVSGLDVSPSMVSAAKAKNPGLAIIEADMISFELDKPVQAILCLFSSIGYIYPDQRLREVAANFHSNLEPAGSIIIEPWLQPSVGKAGHCSQQVYESDDMKLCRAATHVVEGRLSTFDFNWLVTTPDGCEHFVERHQLWMYTKEELLRTFSDAGFEVEWRQDGIMPGRGLLVGKRPER